MTDLLARLRTDPGTLTIGRLLQDREAAAAEIERLLAEVARLRAVNRPPLEAVHRRVIPNTPPTQSRTEQRILLRLADVCAMLAVSRSTIYKRVAEGTFPAPVRISERSVRWRNVDVDAWRAAIESEGDQRRQHSKTRSSNLRR